MVETHAALSEWPWPDEVAEEAETSIARWGAQKDIYKQLSKAKSGKAYDRANAKLEKSFLPTARSSAALTEALGLELSGGLREYLEENDG